LQYTILGGRCIFRKSIPFEFSSPIRLLSILLDIAIINLSQGNPQISTGEELLKGGHLVLPTTSPSTTARQSRHNTLIQRLLAVRSLSTFPPLHQLQSRFHVHDYSPYFSKGTHFPRLEGQPSSLQYSMATSEVDVKFLGQFAENIQLDHPLLAQSLFQILGNLVMLSDKVLTARKRRRLDTTRDTKSVDLYCRIIWYAREGLKLLEEYVSQ